MWVALQLLVLWEYSLTEWPSKNFELQIWLQIGLQIEVSTTFGTGRSVQRCLVDIKLILSTTCSGSVWSVSSSDKKWFSGSKLELPMYRLQHSTHAHLPTCRPLKRVSEVKLFHCPGTYLAIIGRQIYSNPLLANSYEIQSLSIHLNKFGLNKFGLNKCRITKFASTSAGLHNVHS